MNEQDIVERLEALRPVGEVRDAKALKNTHLLEWLKQGYTHCKYGSREWCDSYLSSAHDYIIALEAENERLRAAGFAEGMERAAVIAEGFSGADWIAHDMRSGSFPKQSRPGVAIASAIRAAKEVKT